MLSQDQKSTKGSMEEQKQDQRQSWVGDFFLWREIEEYNIILFAPGKQRATKQWFPLVKTG